jgi:arylsulfatase A-like enzyme
MSSREVKIRNADHMTPGLHSSEMVCNAAIDFIQAQDGSQPFYTYISFLAPHDPRVMPERFKNMYDPADVQLPPNFCGGHVIPTGALQIRDERLAAWPRDPDEVREHIAEYMAMITHLDHELGRVINTLEEKGIYEDTLIVFAGDNGLAVGQHGLMGKQSCYEHSNRVPLIFAGPGVPENTRSEAYVYLLDIFPTLCGLMDAEVPESVEGKSLVPAMTDPSELVRDQLFIGYDRFQRAIKDRRYKLIEYFANEQRNTQLFDLQEDPWEMNNLADDPAHAERLATLRQDLLAWARDWDDLDSEWGKVFWSNIEWAEQDR